MARLCCSTIAAVCLLWGSAAQAAEVNGKWTAEFEVPMVGKFKYVFDLKEVDGKLTGKATVNRAEGPALETTISEGLVTGESISFVEPLKLQDTEIRIEYTGKIAGDEIKFARKAHTWGTTEFTAKRAAAAAVIDPVKAKPVDITGKWAAEFEVNGVGKLKYVYDLKVDGDKVTGKANAERATGRKFANEIIEGKIKGDEVTFVEHFSTQGRENRFEYTGKISGDEIKFVRKGGDRGDSEFVAKRVKEGTPVTTSVPPVETKSSFAGKWTGEFDAPPLGPRKYVYEFTVEGAKLTGKATMTWGDNQKTETEIIDGKIDGDKVTFAEPLKIQGNDLKVEYQGKLTGDELKLTRKVGELGTADFSVKRAK